MLIAVIDGMGGGIGNQVITYLRKIMPGNLQIMALGINPVATGNMMKAQANQGATGENAIIVSARQADIIIAPLSSAIPNAMCGEVTTTIAEAIFLAEAKKYFLPILPNDIELIGVESKPLLLSVREVAEKIKSDFYNKTSS